MDDAEVSVEADDIKLLLCFICKQVLRIADRGIDGFQFGSNGRGLRAPAREVENQLDKQGALLADAVDTRNILYIGLEKPLQTAEFFKKNMRERVGIPTGDRIKKQKLQSFMVFKSARSFLQIPFFQPRTMSLMDRNKASLPMNVI